MQICIKKDAEPKFCKPRPVPFSLKERIESELDRLVQEDILEPVEHSDWATPIVPVIKQNGKLRICGDYKVTINPVLQVDQYPLPRIEDIFADLSGGEAFSKIDLSEAYLQMTVDERDRHLLTINTHKGLFRYKRLNYGVALAPAVWQRNIEMILSGISGVHVFLDDICITGKNDKEHFERLEAVLQRLEKYGLRVNKQKSEFFKPSVQYCGHIIDKFGLHKTPEKIEAILKAPEPKNVSELKSFLGLVNYYAKFVPNMSTLSAPLNALLRKESKFVWNKQCASAYNSLKHEIASDRVLTHYNPKLPLVLQTDASPVGVGAVLNHIMPDGSEKPVMFASRSLTPTERNYSQIEKEALSIVWGVKRFYQYLFGRHFYLVTDHKPLVSIFSPNRSLPTLAATRMIHYAIFLQAFDYTIKYRNSQSHGNADALSRLPLKYFDDSFSEADVHNMSQIEIIPVTASDIAKATQMDKNLYELFECLRNGSKLPDPWKGKESEFSLQQGCILRGHRVVVPAKYQRCILEELHVGHPGIVKMKALARSYCYWRNIDSDIEHFVRNCAACATNKNEPLKMNRHPWEWPNGPWQRIHVDYAGPFMGKMFLIVSDAYSKWIEVLPVPSTTSSITILNLRTLFARYGLPFSLVSDNGRCFASLEFKQFLKQNNIKHMFSAPYHPATNGQAERVVQTFKSAMKTVLKESGDLQTKLQRFLLQYRITPHSLTGETPSYLFLNRNIRTRLDIMRPNLQQIVMQKQSASLNKKPPERDFQEGEKVSVRNYSGPEKFKIGHILTKDGLLHYKVKVGNEIWRRHVDQIKKCGQLLDEEEPESAVDVPDVSSRSSTTPVASSPSHATPVTLSPSSATSDVSSSPSATCPNVASSPKPPDRTPTYLRRSTRISRPPDRLMYT